MMVCASDDVCVRLMVCVCASDGVHVCEVCVSGNYRCYACSWYHIAIQYG